MDAVAPKTVPVRWWSEEAAVQLVRALREGEDKSLPVMRDLIPFKSPAGTRVLFQLIDRLPNGELVVSLRPAGKAEVVKVWSSRVVEQGVVRALLDLKFDGLPEM